MAMLPRAIRFRRLASQLNDAEFALFTSRLVQQFGRSVLLTPLFNQCIGATGPPFDGQRLDALVDMISDIINERDSESEATASSAMTMPSLPGALVGEIASYLEQRSYLNFSKTDRAMFIGCASPNRLVTLDLLRVRDYSAIDVRRFPQITHLKLKLQKFNRLPLPTDGRVCNHLTKLTLHNDKERTADIDDFLASNAINFDYLRSLILSNFGHVRDEDPGTVKVFDQRLFLQILVKLSTIESFICILLTLVSVLRTSPNL